MSVSVSVSVSVFVCVCVREIHKTSLILTYKNIFVEKWEKKFLRKSHVNVQLSNRIPDDALRNTFGD